MIKSSVLKKVIAGVLVLTTVCVFSAGVCFAEGDGPEKIHRTDNDDGSGRVYTVVHEKKDGTADRFVIGPCTPNQEKLVEWYFQKDPKGQLLDDLAETVKKYLQECNNANGANQNEH